MVLSESFTRITLLSKALTAGLFFTLTVAGFFAGIWYQERAEHKLLYIENVKLIKAADLVPTTEDGSGCGETPKFLAEEFLAGGSEVSGPFWSDDCRKLAWGKRLRSASEAAGLETSDLGLYVYETGSRMWSRVYTLNGDGGAELTGWSDSDILRISSDDQREYRYSISGRKMVGIGPE